MPPRVINISGLDKAEVLAALFNNARLSREVRRELVNQQQVLVAYEETSAPQIEKKHYPEELTIEEAQAALGRNSYVEYIGVNAVSPTNAVAIKIDFSGDTIDVTSYDKLYHDNPNFDRWDYNNSVNVLPQRASDVIANVRRQTEERNLATVKELLEKNTSSEDNVLPNSLTLLHAIERLEKGKDSKINPYWFRSQVKLNAIVTELLKLKQDDETISERALYNACIDSGSNLYRSLNLRRWTLFGLTFADESKTLENFHSENRATH